MPMIIDADFPGGNIIVDHVDEDRIDCHQDLRDTDRDWFYWCFRVRGAAGRHVGFNFTASTAIGVRGPAISTDQGASWRWLGSDSVDGNAFRYAFTSDNNDVRFSFAMPYQLADWQRFSAVRSWLTTATLARTRQNRDVPLATVGQGPTRIFVSARHHCCEMLPNYAIEGLINFLHSDTTLLERVTIDIVPLVDLDGVESGDQGKGRLPRDHGRDSKGTSLYPEIAAIRTHLEQSRPAIVLDLHCPWIRGQWNESIYLVGGSDPTNAAEQQRFVTAMVETQVGPLLIHKSDFLPYGTAWNNSSNFIGGKGLARFACGLPGTRLATSIELPYANAEGAEVNAASALMFGEDLARGLMRYLDA